METKFQTSFIPKKPMISMGASPKVSHRGVSLFMTFSVIIFILSLGGVGATYAWKQYLITTQAQYKQQLADREKQFNIDLIEQLKQSNVQIDLAKQVLANHIALSQIFDIITRFTSENVRFLSMDVTAPAGGQGDIKLAMRGYGTSLIAVAFQSDVLGQLEQYGLRKIIKNPILSDPSLDANGTVSFGFSASVDPKNLSYAQSIAPVASTTPAATQSN